MNRSITYIVSVLVTMAAGGAGLAQENRTIFPGWSVDFPQSIANASPKAIAVGDLNADGLPDVAAFFSEYYIGGSRLFTAFGRTDGSLAEPQESYFPTLGTGGAAMAAGDLVPDPDGLLDLVVVGTTPVGMAILRNLGPDGDYCFETNEFYALAGVSGPVTVGDFDGDGLADIAHNGGGGKVDVWFQQPTGWFDGPVEISTGNGIQGLAAADMNDDGLDDLVIVNYTKLSVRCGQPNGTFAPCYETPLTSANRSGVAVEDFNGDGRLDIAIVTTNLARVYVYYANEEGGFAPAQSFDSGAQPARIAAGDVDGDGRPDLVVMSTGAYDPWYGSVLYSRGNAGFSPPVPFTAAAYQAPLAVADLDRDGRSEVLVGGYYPTLAVLRSRPRGLIGTATEYLVGRDPWALAAGDFDRDALSDLAVLNRADDDITILRSTPGGTLERADADLHVGPTPQDLVAGTFDDDNILDLLTTNSGTGSITIWHGDGTWFPRREYLYPTLPGSPSSLTTFYFDDEDDRMDIAFIAGGKVVVLRGIAGGSLDDDHPEVYTCGSGPVDIVAADLNGDGLADLATVNSNRRIAVLYGQLDGTFGDCEEHDVTTVTSQTPTPASIVAGDVNNDGRMDLVSSWFFPPYPIGPSPHFSPRG